MSSCSDSSIVFALGSAFLSGQSSGWSVIRAARWRGCFARAMLLYGMHFGGSSVGL